jgi:F420-0:gamma-glutamyl ligase
VDGVVTTDSAKELASSGCVGVTIGLKEVPGLRPEIEAVEYKPGVGV